MHPHELWWLIDAKRPQKMYGHLTESEMGDLYDDLVDMKLLPPREEVMHG